MGTDQTDALNYLRSHPTLSTDVKSAILQTIIRPVSASKYETDILFSHIEAALKGYEADWGMLDMSPDFQRGHVWSEHQQHHFIENVLRGVVSTSGLVIQFNCPNWDHDAYVGELPRGLQCIDGLQRITAVRKFTAGDMRPFGLSVSDLEDSSFSIKRSIFRLRFAIHTFRTRAQLLRHYLDINTGGTPHSDSEIERVQKMMVGLKPKEQTPTRRPT